MASISRAWSARRKSEVNFARPAASASRVLEFLARRTVSPTSERPEVLRPFSDRRRWWCLVVVRCCLRVRLTWQRLLSRALQKSAAVGGRPGSKKFFRTTQNRNDNLSMVWWLSRPSFGALLRGIAFVTILGLPAAGAAVPQIETAYKSQLSRALQLLLAGDRRQAKIELEKCLAVQPASPEVHYHLARLHLLQFFQEPDRDLASASLRTAASEIDEALKLNPSYVEAWRLKFELHRSPGLLHYNPDSAFEIAQRVIALDPFCYDFQLDLAEWMSSGVRFDANNPDRDASDTNAGLNRTIGRLARLLRSVVPHTSQEQRALSLIGRAFAKNGQFPESLPYFQSRLARPLNNEERAGTMRDLGTSYFRMGNFSEAANFFASAYELRPSLPGFWLLKVCFDKLGYSSNKLPAQLSFPLRQERWDESHPPLTQFSRIDPPAGLDRIQGHGAVAWGDFDRDGRDDVLISGSGAFLTLLKNEGNSFRDITAQAELSGIPSGYSLNFVDYDNDGWLDIYVCLNGWSGPLPNRLLRNLGNGTFQDVSKPAGVDDAGSGFVSLWGDLDRDGDLDLVVANGVLKDGSTPQIYRNLGDGTFENVTRKAGIIEPPEYGTIGIALGDYDRDGDLDLFINGWDPAPNRLYRNNGDFTFTEVAQQAGVQETRHQGSACVFFDYDNDAYPDILAANLASWESALSGLMDTQTVNGLDDRNQGVPKLFRNLRNGTFKDVTAEAGLTHPIGAVSVVASDLDNDGFVDLYFGTSGSEWGRLEPSRFYHNNGNGTFSDLTRYAGLNHIHKTSALSALDFDNDGDLDLYVQSGGLFPGEWGRNLLYRNEAGNRHRWLQVSLTGQRSNRFGLGAQLIVKAGALTVYRQQIGDAAGAIGSSRVAIGVGENDSVDSLEVVWPSGERQTLGRIQANRVIRIIEPGRRKEAR